MKSRSVSLLVPCKVVLISAALFSGAFAVAQNGKSDFNYGKDIDKLVSAMSIEQKVGQMTQINIDVISKGAVYNLQEPHQLDEQKLDNAINKYFVGSVLNVGGHTYTREHWEEVITTIQKKATSEGSKVPIIYGIDAIHGVNYTVDATLFPQQIGQAATWNPALVEQGASVTAYECRASGIPWNFSPVLDIGRNPWWSRFFETYGEDVFLAKQMSKACIRGYQGNDASNPEKVAACMKHFLGYSTPLSGKDRTPAWIPDIHLREYFIPTFQEAIKEGALTVMINSGEVNGVPVHASYDILTSLLRDELGFNGLVLTDWEDIIKLYRDHRVAKDMKEAVKLSVMAGVDMSMTPNDYTFNDALIQLVKDGEIPESRLDLSCKRILWVKKQLGLLDNPMPDYNKYEKFASDEHKQVALKTAAESITLLKNENAVLPLKADAKILVCGPAANSLNIMNGAWTHTWQGVEEKYNTKGALTIFDALKKEGEGTVDYALGASLTAQQNMKEITEKAVGKDAIVVCLGELPSTEKPGDIDELDLSDAQQALVSVVKSLGKPVILAFVFNRPLIVRDVVDKADAIVHCYLPGDQGGTALAKILYGRINPSGKLPFTYPRYSGTLVPYDHKSTETLDQKFGHDAFNPQWQFGYGLSYSGFQYKNLKLDKIKYAPTDVIQVSCDVSNTSEVDGKEVVQVYIRDDVASITPSVKRLRAFSKIEIPGNTTKTVQLEVPVSELAFVNNNGKWVTEAGTFELTVGRKKVSFSVE